jgi:hypothetical protein
MFWRRKRKEIADEATRTAAGLAEKTTDLAEKTMTIGPTGVLLLLGAAAVGAAATYYVAQKRRNKKAAR